MLTAFLDANVLFSAAWREDAGVARLWHIEGLRLVTSVYALEEALRNLPDRIRIERLSCLVGSVTVLPSVARVSLPADVSLPDKDRVILQDAIGADAQFLVTGDLRHFGPFMERTISGVTVLTPAETLRRLGG